MWFYHGDKVGDWLTFDAAISNPPFAGGDDDEGVVMYERTQNGVTYIVCGTRRYEVTDRGNLRWVGDVEPVKPVSWWHRLWAWLRRWL